MEKFEISKEESKQKTVNRTVRLKGETYDKLFELSEETGVSFNKIVNQALEYALKQM